MSDGEIIKETASFVSQLQAMSWKLKELEITWPEFGVELGRSRHWVLQVIRHFRPDWEP